MGQARVRVGRLRPAAASDRVDAEREARRRSTSGERDRVGDRGEAEHGHREADRAAAGGQDPQQLVAAQRVGQQQPDEPEAADPEHHDGRAERAQRVRDRAEGLVARRVG